MSEIQCTRGSSKTGNNNNSSPVIAILTQPDRVENSSRTYIAASYVKFLKSSGARVAPVPAQAPDDKIDEIFHSVNGVLLPGGHTVWNEQTSSYYRHAIRFWNNAKKANDSGDYFPILGICLGFEAMCIIQAGKNTGILSRGYETLDIAMSLDFRKDPKESRIFGDFPEDILSSLKTEKITYNSHVCGVSMETCETQNILNDFFNVVSTNTDSNGMRFVSTVEAKDYPFYGVQWHPEKNTFEFNTREKKNIPKTTQADRMAQHISNFFVGQACQSGHRFKSEEKLKELLICNHQLEQTSNTDGKLKNFEQCYMFD